MLLDSLVQGMQCANALHGNHLPELDSSSFHIGICRKESDCYDQVFQILVD